MGNVVNTFGTAAAIRLRAELSQLTDQYNREWSEIHNRTFELGNGNVRVKTRDKYELADAMGRMATIDANVLQITNGYIEKIGALASSTPPEFLEGAATMAVRLQVHANGHIAWLMAIRDEIGGKAQSSQDSNTANGSKGIGQMSG